MIKVQLKTNVRMYEADDSEFYIQGREIKELPEKHLRSYSIKYYLFHGLLEIVEGYTIFKFKAGTLYIAKDTLYCNEYGKYFKKDLELDTITFIEKDEVPKDILEHLNPTAIAKEPIVEEAIVEEEAIKYGNYTEVELYDLTKDELNDLASQLGFNKEINTRMKKAVIIETLKDLVKKETEDK